MIRQQANCGAEPALDPIGIPNLEMAGDSTTTNL